MSHRHGVGDAGRRATQPSRRAPATRRGRASSSATASAVLRGLRRTASRPSLLLPTWSIVPSRFWKAADRLPGPALPGRHVRRPRQRAGPTGRAARRPTPTRSTPPTRSRCWTRPAPSARCWSRCPAARVGGARGRRAPRAGRGLVCDRARLPLGARPPGARRVRSRTRSTTDEGWAKYNRHYWLERLPRLPRVLLRADVHRAALDQADRGLRRLGRSRSTPETLVDTDRGRWAATARRRAVDALRRRCAARCWSSTAPTTGSARTRSGERLAELTGGELVLLEGAGHGPHAPRPGRCQPPDQRDFVDATARRRRRAGSRGRAPPATRALLPVLADRARPRPARRRDRRRAAPLHPDLQIDWLAQHPVTAGARGRAASACTRRPRTWRNESGAHRARVAASTTCTRSRRSAGWTRSWSPTSWCSHDVVARRALRPGGRRRGLGRRLLPAREPGAEAGRRSPG